MPGEKNLPGIFHPCRFSRLGLGNASSWRSVFCNDASKLHLWSPLSKHPFCGIRLERVLEYSASTRPGVTRQMPQSRLSEYWNWAIQPCRFLIQILPSNVGFINMVRQKRELKRSINWLRLFHHNFWLIFSYRYTRVPSQACTRQISQPRLNEYCI